MRFLRILLISIIFLACSRNSATEVTFDSTVSVSKPVAADHSAQFGVQFSEDSSFFISPVRSFAETSEYYVPLYYLESVQEEHPYEFLSTQLDSLIYQNEDDETRRRLPFSIAKQYFRFSGISRISVYNKQGDLITDAVLNRIEYLEGTIESEFVAVYKPMIPSWFTTDVAYCTTAAPDVYQAVHVTSETVVNKPLTKKLMTEFNLDSMQVMEVKHLRMQPYNRIYSAVNLPEGSLLIETSGNKSAIVLETKDNDAILEILPVHLEINHKPVLLITSGVHDTDMIWTALAVFDSTMYKIMPGSRVKLK